MSDQKLQDETATTGAASGLSAGLAMRPFTPKTFRFTDDFSVYDLEATSGLDRREAENHLTGSSVCRSLCIGRLHEGLRRFGRWAGQLQVGRLSILFVVQDRRYLQHIRERERFLRGRHLNHTQLKMISFGPPISMANIEYLEMFRVTTRNISAYPARPLPGECMPDRATLLPKSLLEQSRTHSIAALPWATIQAGRRAVLRIIGDTHNRGQTTI